jgi:hypothetical protein
VESVSHFRLAWRARNKPPRSTASDVSVAALANVVVGISKKVKDTGVIEVDGSVQEPMKLKDPVGVFVDNVLVDVDELELDVLLVPNSELIVVDWLVLEV